MKYTIVFVLLYALLTACTKNYLEESPSNLFGTADDLVRLKSTLGNDILMSETPALGEESADDYYLLPEVYNQLPLQHKNVYTWEKDIYHGQVNIPDYSIPYSQVFTCNLVLEGLSKIDPGVYQRDWRETKGIALFMRSYAFFNLVQIFADAYDSASAPVNPGVSMPLSTDISLVPARSNLKDTYEKIIADLATALPLVPQAVTTRSLPSKPAVFALLARVYLIKQQYKLAYAMADSCINMHDSLLDFNTINLSTRFPIEPNNKEILYQSKLSSFSNVILGRKECMVDTTLYACYNHNDLRKEAFFFMHATGRPAFETNGTGKGFAFSGLSIGEMYLIRAECAARMGALPQATADINTLQEKRYATGTFIKYEVTNYRDAMRIILLERRKELVFRGLRWADIKRLNKEEAGIVLTRVIAGQTIQLLPESNHYILPLPDDALLGGTIQQNIRD